MTAVFHAYPAPAKLNLMLKVVGRRADGYHLLETVFRFIDYSDTVELALRDDGVIELLNPIDGVPAERDLTVRAARLLQQHSGTSLGASIRLTKRIPMGGGLGGGSSDAATVLLALNALWQTAVPRETLMQLGLTLGADVPVFIFGRNAFATGVGEELTELDLPEKWYVVLHPGVHIPTAEIFSSKLLTRDSGISIMRILETTQQRRNDLQRVVTSKYPAVNEALSELEKYGSPLMTGSGSCVFLECDSENEADKVYKTL
ncbi:MAG TPA: 4-(cytidine 5'-diphospho)-2-C-methyl-D-erythritol kinase, partial [Pseudogulbenkiania sp.]|nr:4-(cytidine 5'-diphospho)-2-C-methyl-D-erythritol kinase [Pseudogulbenkiania sp.]